MSSIHSAHFINYNNRLKYLNLGLALDITHNFLNRRFHLLNFSSQVIDFTFYQMNPTDLYISHLVLDEDLRGVGYSTDT
jgi:hypothetical protein